MADSKRSAMTPIEQIIYANAFTQYLISAMNHVPDVYARPHHSFDLYKYETEATVEAVKAAGYAVTLLRRAETEVHDELIDELKADLAMYYEAIGHSTD